MQYGSFHKHETLRTLVRLPSGAEEYVCTFDLNLSTATGHGEDYIQTNTGKWVRVDLLARVAA